LSHNISNCTYSVTNPANKSASPSSAGIYLDTGFPTGNIINIVNSFFSLVGTSPTTNFCIAKNASVISPIVALFGCASVPIFAKTIQSGIVLVPFVDLNAVANTQVMYSDNGVPVGDTGMQYMTLGALTNKTLQLGGETFSFQPTVRTALGISDTYNGSMSALLAQNGSTATNASINIYLSNAGASETDNYSVIGMNNPNYNSGSNYISEQAKNLYIGNSNGDISIMPNFYDGGNVHLAYESGTKAISVTNVGAISTSTTFNPGTQQYDFSVGTPGQVLI
jgi:hypothetical protein